MTPPLSLSQPPHRYLFGPGPGNVEPRVMQAMLAPLLGHLDPDYFTVLDDIQRLLRQAFETDNRVTFSISGTGGAGMEACVANLVEDGEPVLCCVNGFFGQRLSDLCERWGGRVTRVEAEWGKPLEMDRVREAFRASGARILTMVQAETSTGMLQPVEQLKSLRDIRDAIFVVDTVTSLGIHPVGIDRNTIDASYSCSQKGLAAPPGLAPVTFSERAMEKIRGRREKPRSWYLDVQALDTYWGAPRAYHHTSPASMNYGLREALAIVVEEGLENRWKRHEGNSAAFVAGVEAMGLGMLAPKGHRLWGLNAVSIPEGVDDATVRARLLREHSIEIGSGFGSLKGKIWRVGLMGFNSTRTNVLMLLAALRSVL